MGEKDQIFRLLMKFVGINHKNPRACVDGGLTNGHLIRFSPYFVAVAWHAGRMGSRSYSPSGETEQRASKTAAAPSSHYMPLILLLLLLYYLLFYCYCCDFTYPTTECAWFLAVVFFLFILVKWPLDRVCCCVAHTPLKHRGHELIWKISSLFNGKNMLLIWIYIYKNFVIVVGRLVWCCIHVFHIPFGLSLSLSCSLCLCIALEIQTI